MKYSELIHGFFDEGIPADDEETLFSALAGDRELRREFVEHLKISSFVQHDMAGSAPPSDVTDAIFDAIGLPDPGGTVPDGNVWTRIGGFFLRMLPLFLVVFVTASLTVGGYFLLRDSVDEAPLKTDHAAQTASASIPASTIPGAMEDVPRSSSHVSKSHTGVQQPVTEMESSVSLASNAVAHRKLAAGTVAPTVEAHAAETYAALPGDPAAVRNETIVADVQQSGSAVPALLFEMGGEGSADIPSAPVVYRTPEPNAGACMGNTHSLQGMPEGQTVFTITDLIFQLRFIGAHSAYPNTGLPTPSSGLFKNMAFTALYKISERHALGFSYGREPVGRIYSRMVEKTDLLSTTDVSPSEKKYVSEEFRDYDMLDWGGITWKTSYTSMSLFNTVYPFTEVFAGATKYGPLGRLLFGIELYPSNFSMLNIGIELSTLGYEVEDKWYTSNKLGGSFGIAIAL